MALAFDAVQTASGSGAFPAFSFTPGGAGRLILLALAWSAAGGSVGPAAACTCGGVPMTQCGDKMDAGTVSLLWHRLPNAGAGPLAMAAYMDAVVDWAAVALAYTGAMTTAPMGPVAETAVAGPTASVSVPDVPADGMIVDAAVVARGSDATIALGAHGGQTVRATQAGGAAPNLFLLGCSDDAGGGTVDDSWTASATVPLALLAAGVWPMASAPRGRVHAGMGLRGGRRLVRVSLSE